MKKASYHQRQDRVYYPNYQRTNTTNRKKYYGLLLAGFFVFTVLFGASAWGVEHDGGDAGSSSYYQQEYGKKGIGAGVVGATGIMNYSYPMGDAGVSYESSNGTWAVAGFGAITRDTTKGVPSYDYTKDTFLLNGEKLVYESSGTNVRYYHTERESYLKISYHYPGNTSSSYWIVKAKDGTVSYYGKSYYGGTTNSRIGAVRTGGGVRCWALGETYSINNNSLTTYYYDANSTHGDYYLTKIISGKINASKFRTTYLYYDYAAGDFELYPYLSYRQCAKVTINRKRLKSVLVKMGTNSSGSGGYNHSAFKLEWSISLSDKYLLDAVTEYGSNVAFDGTGDPNTFVSYDITSGSHLPATEFDYSDENFELSSNYVSWGNPNNHALKAIKDDRRSYTDLMDMNGDGMADLVEKVGDFEIYLGTGSGFSSVAYWGDHFDRWLRESYGGDTICDVIDMNGDGLPDRVYHSQGHDEFEIKLNNGSGFPTYADWDIHRGNLDVRDTDTSGNVTSELIDMNGDGLVDIVEKKSGESLKIYLGTGGNFKSTPESWDNANPYGKPLRQFENLDDRNTVADLIDMNGDGLPDRVKYTNSGLRVRLNTGKGFSSTDLSTWDRTDYIRRVNYDGDTTRDLVDFNGDGLLDHISKTTSNTFHELLINTGSRFVYIAYTDRPSCNCGKVLRQKDDDDHIVSDFADMNGDGLADRVVKTRTGNFQVWLNQSSSRHAVLTEIINPHGGTTTYTYKAVDKSDNPDMKISLWVVDTVTVNDGMGGSYSTSTTSYEYTGGKYVNVVGNREFRGFAKVVITDPSGNKTETHYHQDDVLKGLVKKSMTRDSSNRIYDYAYNHYTDYAGTSGHYGYGVSGVHSPLLTQVDKYVVDGSTSTDSGTKPYGTTWKRMKLTTSYHNYGDLSVVENLGEVNSSGSDIGYDKAKTTFSYAVDTNYWVIKPYNKSVYGTNGQSSTYVTQLQERYYYDSGIGLGSWLDHGLIDQGRLKLVYKYTGSRWIYAERFGYDSYGNVTHVQDANGKTTQTVYDSQYRSFSVKTIMPTVSAGTFSSYIYYDTTSYTGTSTTTISNNITRGRPVMARDINSQFTKTYYDNLGRVTKLAKPGDSESSPTIQYYYINYSSSNNPAYVRTTLKDSYSGLRSYAYIDGLGRTIQTKKEALEGDSSTTKWATVNTWNYYSGTHAITETTALYFSSTSNFNRGTSPYGGRTKTESYYGGSTYGKVTKVTAPDGTISYTYSKRLVTTTRNAKNYGGTLNVDGLGNVIEIKAYSDTYSYGSLYRTDKFYYNTGTGQLVKKIEDYGTGKNNITTTMAYDRLGRKILHMDPDAYDMWYYYDSKSGYTTSNGNLIGQKDAKGNETKLQYDAWNRMRRKDYPSGTDTYFYYDEGGSAAYENGLLTRVTDASGSTVINYDSRGRISSEVKTISGLSAKTTSYTYDSMDRVNTLTYPDGEVVKHTYLADGNLDLLGTTADTDKYVDDIHYDAFGRMTYQDYGNEVETSYTYQGQSWNYRLRRISLNGDKINMSLASYHYDSVGNIDCWEAWDFNAMRDFTYDHQNRLSSEHNFKYGPPGRTINYIYNAINNITSKGGISYSYNNGTNQVKTYGQYTYSYDANGNMTEKVHGGSGEAITYHYNYANRLTQVSDCATASYTYDYSGNRVKKVEGGVTTYYINGYYEVEDGYPIKYYFANGQRIAKNDNGTLTYYHKDHLGSNTVISDSTGDLGYKIQYQPYGEIFRTFSYGLPSPVYKFTDKEMNAAGLYYYGARYYDPLLTRFISPDAYGGNYVYCNNNPVMNIDPTGNYVESLLDIGFISYDLNELRKDPSALNVAALGADLACLALPVATGGGAAVRGGAAALKGKKLTRAVSEFNRKLQNPVNTRVYNALYKGGDGLLSHRNANKVADIASNAAEGTVWGVPASIIGQYFATGEVDMETLVYDALGFGVFGGGLGATQPYTTSYRTSGKQKWAGTTKGKLWDATLGTGSYYPAILISGSARGYTPIESSAVYIKSRPMWFGQNYFAPPGSPQFQPVVFNMRWSQKVIEGGGFDPNEYFWNAIGGYPFESYMPGSSGGGNYSLTQDDYDRTWGHDFEP